MRDYSWEGLEEMYEKGQVSEDEMTVLLSIRNLSDDEWKEIKEEYLQGNMSQEEFEQIKQIREMPEEWTTFKNGAKGILYGEATGIWEGLQWYVGGKLGNWTAKGVSKIGMSAIRVSADTVFNAYDSFYRTLLSSWAKGTEFWKEFDDKGGIKTVITDIGIGLIGSAGGEIIDVVKSIKNKKYQESVKNTLENELNNTKKIDIKNTLENELNNIEKIDINNTLEYNKNVENIVKFIEENTNAMYDKEKFRNLQYSILENLIKAGKNSKESSIFVSSVFEKIIKDRGGFELIKRIDNGNININVIKDINWNNVNYSLEEIEDYVINIMPEKLRESVKEINISDLYNPHDTYWSIEYKDKRFMSACTGGWNNGISQINIFAASTNMNELLHEAGHCVDVGMTCSNSPYWNLCMIKDQEITGKIGVSDYATNAKKACNTNAEDFADSIRFCCLNSKLFKEMFPARYEYLKKLLNF